MYSLFKLVLFDIDGTLLMSGGGGKRALNRAFLKSFGVSEAFEGIPVAGRTDHLILEDAVSRAGVSVTTDLRADFYSCYFNFLKEEILKPGPRKGLMPGVKELLNRLDVSQNIVLGLLTGNFFEAAKIKLTYFDLWHYFICGAYGDDGIQRRELVPVALKRARDLGKEIQSVAQVIIVGDTPLDIECAKSTGALSIAVATGYFSTSELKSHGADHVMTDLQDSDAFIKIIDGAG
tara:strand:- start:164 stop:865 length:702 start_codon:yes stop_codon:yes gene_type:complete